MVGAPDITEVADAEEAEGVAMIADAIWEPCGWRDQGAGRSHTQRRRRLAVWSSALG